MGSIPRFQIHSRSLVCRKHNSYFLEIIFLLKKSSSKYFSGCLNFVPVLKVGYEYCKSNLQFTSNLICQLCYMFVLPTNLINGLKLGITDNECEGLFVLSSKLMLLHCCFLCHLSTYVCTPTFLLDLSNLFWKLKGGGGNPVNFFHDVIAPAHTSALLYDVVHYWPFFVFNSNYFVSVLHMQCNPHSVYPAHHFIPRKVLNIYCDTVI